MSIDWHNGLKLLIKHLYNGAWLTFGVGFTLNIQWFKNYSLIWRVGITLTI
jgi:hypothetical protein